MHLIKGLGPGGAERLLVGFAATADRDRFDHEFVYVLRRKDHLASEVASYGHRVRGLGVRSASDLRWLWRLRVHLVRAQPSLVHVHSPLPAAALRLLVLTLRPSTRPRTISTEHVTWDAYALPTRLVNRATYGLDAHHFAVSSEVQASVHAKGHASTEVLIHGIDLDRVRARSLARARVRSELGLDDGAIAVVTVANYRAQKDYPTLLAAAELVIDQRPDVRFVIVGQGPLASFVEESVNRSSSLRQNVVLLGYRPDAVDVLAAGDVFALASTREGLPVALMEALALGLPVVCTAVGGVPSVITEGEQGMLVPPARPALLAEAILAVVADPESRAAMAVAARERASQFDARYATQRMQQVYAQLSQRPAGSSAEGAG